MANFRIVITDVTNFGSRLFCVAGWDLTSGQMIRPEPPGTRQNAVNSRFWDAQHVGAGRVFQVGNVVDCVGERVPATFSRPHSTEDVILNRHSHIDPVNVLDLKSVARAVAAGTSDDLASAFDGGLIREHHGKSYVPTGFDGRSLGAIETKPNQLAFSEDVYGNRRKLRLQVTSGGQSYDLSVAAVAARSRWLQRGLAALQGDLARASKVHIRLGLARGFDDMPDRCWAQINGIYFL